MTAPHRRALALAGIQAADLAVTQLSAEFGDSHLDHLGVPRGIRPLLPIIKAVGVTALVVTADRPTARSVVAASLMAELGGDTSGIAYSERLMAYYAAAGTFHLRAGDPPWLAAPAAGCCLLAASLVGERSRAS